MDTCATSARRACITRSTDAGSTRHHRHIPTAKVAASIYRRRPCCVDTMAVAHSTILRLAGIYGPGRVPRAADVIAGRPIHSPETGYLNLIHVDDAAASVMAVWARATRHESTQPLYLIADDQPVVRKSSTAKSLINAVPPNHNLIAPTADRPVSVRSESNKRIWNRRMKRDLLPRLQYPTYREGLADVLRDSSIDG